MWSVVENVQLNSKKLFNLPCGESREGINELVASLLSLHSQQNYSLQVALILDKTRISKIDLGIFYRKIF